MMAVYQGYIIRPISIDLFNNMHSILDVHDLFCEGFGIASKTYDYYVVLFIRSIAYTSPPLKWKYCLFEISPP